MKKKGLFLLFLLVAILLVGCGDKEEKVSYKLYITESSWSGWTPDYKPEEVTTEYTVEKGKKIKFDRGFAIEITNVTKDSIEFTTNEAMTTGSMLAEDLQTKFTVKKGEKLEIVTPTMDAGDIYIFELK